MSNGLKIPYERFLMRVVEKAQQTISIKVSELSDLNISDEEFEELYASICRRIKQRIKTYIKSRKLVAVPYRYRFESDGRYRRHELDIDDRDIPKKLIDVEGLIPDLKERIKNEIQLQLQESVESLCESE